MLVYARTVRRDYRRLQSSGTDIVSDPYELDDDDENRWLPPSQLGAARVC